MLVFVDPNNKTITICDKNVQVFHWSQLSLISSLLSGKEIIYVVEAIETTGDEVVKMIRADDEEDIGDQTHVTEEKLYFHTTKEETIRFMFAGKEYALRGLGDCRSIESLPEGFFEKCTIVVDGVRDGLFEFITENEKQKIQEKCHAKKAAFQAARNGILRDDSESAIDIALGSSKKRLDDPIEIDLGKKSFKR